MLLSALLLVVRPGVAAPAEEAWPWTAWPSVDAIEAELEEIAALAPDVAEVVDLTDLLGTDPTAEGRRIVAVRVSDHPGEEEDEPVALVVAAHHGREVATPRIALGLIRHLADGYGTDPRVRAVVDANEIDVAPLWNPDGYAFARDEDPTWRKNRRVLDGGVGVDLNRNYPFGWDSPCGGSLDPADRKYRGPEPLSEAETQTMEAWANRTRPARILDVHAFGRTVLTGYACADHPFAGWQEDRAREFSKAAGWGGRASTPSAEGEHAAWQFAAGGGLALTLEVGTSYWPDQEEVEAEIEALWPAVLAWLEAPAPLSGHVTDAATGAPLAARIHPDPAIFPNGEVFATGETSGRFSLWFPPGSWDLCFDAPDHVPVRLGLSVEEGRTMDWDVALEPSSGEASCDDPMPPDGGSGCSTAGHERSSALPWLLVVALGLKRRQSGIPYLRSL